MYSWVEIIEQMKTWADNNIENNPSLLYMARRFGYSYFYITKKFHEIEGISFREYMNKCKMLKAANDLYTTRERIIDIAVKYNYSSQEAFTRAFTKVYGITPALYRRRQKPTLHAEKSFLIGIGGQTKPHLSNGGKDMKLYVKQMFDWNCYAYYAEDVDEKYWEYFKAGYWWQIGNAFIKPYDNVDDFKYCADNFTKNGELFIKQCLKIIDAPWEKALNLFIEKMKKVDAPWFIHGSAAMALWNIDVKPRNLDIIIPNYSDFDKVRNIFYKFAVIPIERCDNWVMSGGGDIFLEAPVSIYFNNKDLEPFDMNTLHKINYKNNEIYISTLEMLKQDNEYYGRPERVKLIEEKMK